MIESQKDKHRGRIAGPLKKYHFNFLNSLTFILIGPQKNTSHFHLFKNGEESNSTKH